MTTTLCPGDRVNWWHRQRGGYGYLVPVAGVVERVGPRRVQIRVAQQVRPGWWRQVVRWVDPSRLTPREKYVPEVDGMEQQRQEADET